MALGDGVGRNKSAKHWIDRRHRDYFKGAEDFLKWLLSNEKYNACLIDPDENYIVSIPELLAEFKNSLK